MSRSSLASLLSPIPLLVLAAALLSWAYVVTLQPHGMDVGALLRPRVVAEEHRQMAPSEMDTSGMEGTDGAGMDMGAGDGGSGSHSGMHEAHEGSMPITAFLAGWIVMMAAMMLPAVIPVVMLVGRWSRSQGQPQYRLAAFLTGYLLVWGLAGVAYYLLIEALTRWIPSSETGVRIAASVLLLAGIYQFTPLKDRCLTACRTPLSFLMTHGGRMARGAIGYVDVGARHGLFCLGCCWMLMVILVLLGAMNILWMILLAGVIFVEKATRFGAAMSKVTGVTVVMAAAVFLAAPGLIL